MKIVRCISCDGFGWLTDDFTGEAEDCDWCGGTGYVYRDESGVDRRIPASDYEKVSDRLEELEAQRLREMGYQGEAKKPWDQDIRRGTKGGINPYEQDQDDDH